MKNEEIRSFSVDELKQQIASLEATYDKMRFSHSVTPLQNPLEIRFMRKQIARFKTELRSRGIEEVKSKLVGGSTLNDLIGSKELSIPFKKGRLKKIIAQVKNS